MQWWLTSVSPFIVKKDRMMNSCNHAQGCLVHLVPYWSREYSFQGKEENKCNSQELQHFLYVSAKMQIIKELLLVSSLAGHLATSEACLSSRVLGHLTWNSAEVPLWLSLNFVQIQMHDFYLKTSMKKWGNWSISA